MRAGLSAARRSARITLLGPRVSGALAPEDAALVLALEACAAAGTHVLAIVAFLLLFLTGLAATVSIA